MNPDSVHKQEKTSIVSVFIYFKSPIRTSCVQYQNIMGVCVLQQEILAPDRDYYFLKRGVLY